MAEEDFRLLVQSLLISLLYNEKTATIELVSDYPLERPQYGSKANSVRGFIKHTFHQVDSIDFKPGFQLIPLLKPSGYSTCDSRQPIIIQQVQSRDSQAYFDFGYSYGELSFTYSQLGKQTKITYATKSADNVFQYFDIVTNTPVLFCYPFEVSVKADYNK
ncbi:hypothetical protein GCM10027592_58720 [Spirosoma flavus]